MTPEQVQPPLPQAVLRPERRFTWPWLVPLAAAALAGWLGYQSWTMRGFNILVHLEQGHGLREGDDVRYRGVAVGRVESISMSKGMDGVEVRASLETGAQHLARAGARFWVVRPQLRLTGIAGLETLVGPRYLTMLPGDGAPQRRFVGLTDPPLVESIVAGDLEIVLESAQRSGMRPGAPVLYRQIPVGTLLSVGLTSDGGAVEARAHVQKAYAQLVRPETKFWSAAGAEAHIGIRGASFEVESLEALLEGGVRFATPPDAGDVVRTGHRFQLAEEPDQEWLEWQPMVAIGSPLLPPGAIRPAPLRAVIGWREGRWIKSDKSRHGWVLQTARGLLGPANLLTADADMNPDTVVLEVAGRPLPLNTEPVWNENGLALLDARLTAILWPASLERSVNEPEDCLLVADPAAAPLPLTASRLTAGPGGWTVDSAIPLDETWHGACVLAHGDGYLIGILLVDDDQARIAMLPAE
jgi:hypothetical protein